MVSDQDRLQSSARFAASLLKLAWRLDAGEASAARLAKPTKAQQTGKEIIEYMFCIDRSLS
jgi:hypothetical protein